MTSQDSNKTRLKTATALVAGVALWACNPPAPPEPAPQAEQEAPYDGPELLVDVAAETGLDFEHWNGMVGEYYYSEMMGAGAALFDYDNDGDLDVYLVQGNLIGNDTAGEALFPAPGPLPLSDRLFRNDLEVAADGTRSLRFTDVTEEAGLRAEGYGMGVVAADFDNDGWVDLYVTNLERNQMLRNRGDAGGTVTFEDVTDEVTGIRRWSVPAVVVDYDVDGWLDLFVGNYVIFTAATNKRCSDELGLPNYCGPLAFAPAQDNLLRNRGGAFSFEDVTGRAGVGRDPGRTLGALAADFDRDGRPDLYVANDGSPNHLWAQSGDGTFENRALVAGSAVGGHGVPEASMGVAAADFDGDGDTDLFISHLARETNTLYVNNGAGLFTDGSSVTGLGAPSWAFTGFGTGFFDLDNDGRLDQLTVNGAVKVIKEQALAGDPFPLHQRNQLYVQGEDGKFEDASDRAGSVFRLSEVSRGAVFGDVDNDGDADVVVTNNNGPVRLLLNQARSESAGGWLGLRLVSGDGRRDMIGARAGLTLDDGTTLWRHVDVSSSYASSNDPRLLFGLGGRAPSELVVHWPDGRRERWTTLAPGTYSTLRQGGGSRVP